MISIKLKEENITSALEALARRLADMTPVMDVIGKVLSDRFLFASVRDAFEGPGKMWQLSASRACFYPHPCGMPSKAQNARSLDRKV